MNTTDIESSKKWLDEANKGKEDYREPIWKWDCGLKLDYDGPLMRVSSRFYHINNDIFDGSVMFMIGDREIYCQEFSTRHIDTLKAHVEQYIALVSRKLAIKLNEIIDDDVFS